MPLQYIYTLFMEHDLSLGALAVETVAQQKRDYYQVRGPCCPSCLLPFAITAPPKEGTVAIRSILLMRKQRPRDAEELAQGYPAEIQTSLPVVLQNWKLGGLLSVPRRRPWHLWVRQKG